MIEKSLKVGADGLVGSLRPMAEYEQRDSQYEEFLLKQSQARLLFPLM